MLQLFLAKHSEQTSKKGSLYFHDAGCATNSLECGSYINCEIQEHNLKEGIDVEPFDEEKTSKNAPDLDIK